MEEENKWVFIVMRKKNDILQHLFVFEHLIDADNCAHRLNKMYPDETVTVCRHVIRKDCK